jgi:hypothetical protein
MDLKSFLKSLPDDLAREAFAASCGTTIGHLRNIGYGQKPCSTEIAVAMELHSVGVVTRIELCPATWRLRWPELVTARREGCEIAAHAKAA